MSLSRFPWKHGPWGNHSHADVPFQQQRVTARSFCALLCLILKLSVYSVILNFMLFDLWSAYPHLLSIKTRATTAIRSQENCAKIFRHVGISSPMGEKSQGESGEYKVLFLPLAYHTVLSMTGVNKQVPQGIYKSTKVHSGIYSSTNIRNKDLGCLFNTRSPFSRRYSCKRTLKKLAEQLCYWKAPRIR